jgi:hypothetical protein
MRVCIRVCRLCAGRPKWACWTIWLLGQAESGALPAMISAVLAKTEYRDLNGLVARCRKAASTSKSNPGSGPAPIYRSPPSS